MGNYILDDDFYRDEHRPMECKILKRIADNFRSMFYLLCIV